MPRPVNPKLSVVVPVYGCYVCLETLAERVHASVVAEFPDYELILVDDASPDPAWGRIVELATRCPQIRGLRLTRNFGQHYAIAAGIEHAHGDIVVVMDCDLQDMPEEIPRLLAALDADPDLSVAFAQRIDRNDSALKRFFSWAFFRTLSWLTGVKQDHTTANFGAYRRKVIDAVNRMPERDRCFPLMVKWTGFHSAAVPVQHTARSHGRSGYGFRNLLRLGIGIVLSYSDKPLRLVVKMGLAFSAVAIAMAFTSVYRYFQGDVQVAGFTSIIASVWLLGGACMACLGIVGLYVGQVFRNVQGRPSFVVAEDTSQRVLPHD